MDRDTQRKRDNENQNRADHLEFFLAEIIYIKTRSCIPNPQNIVSSSSLTSKLIPCVHSLDFNEPPSKL